MLHLGYVVRESAERYEVIDITNVTHLIQQKDFSAVIKSPALFKTLFYKVIADQNLDGYIKVKRNREFVTVAAHPDYRAELDKNIEIIRRCFERAHGLKQNFVFCGVNASSDQVVIESQLKEKYEYGDYFSLSTCKIRRALFADLIMPAMQQVTESLAAHCTITSEQREVHLKGRLALSSKVNLDVFSIVWSNREHFVYPVPPTLPQEQPQLSRSLYQFYRAPEQPHCDLTIVDKDGRTIKVHSLVLQVCESKRLQSLLPTALASKGKKLVFDNFGLEAIKKFIDFAYLGHTALDPNNWQTKEISTTGLLPFAHFLEMPAFMDCCTNLLSLTSTKDDAAHIRTLAKLYDNEHLKLLAEYLNGQEPTQPSKRGRPTINE